MKLLCSLSIAVFALSTPLSSSADPEPLPGWGGNRADAGIDLPEPVTYGSVAVAEIDSTPGLDVAVATAGGHVVLTRSDGTVAWTTPLPIAGCSDTSNTNKVLSSVAVGALFGDSTKYVVVGYGGVGGKSCGGGVIALNGNTGAVRWNFDLKKFAKSEQFGTTSHSVFSTPALADVDGDGQLEIGFGSFDRNVYLLNANGQARWYYNAADTVWSSAAFINVDRNPDLELVIGTDISGNSVIRPPTYDGGYLYAFRTSSGVRTPLKKPRTTRSATRAARGRLRAASTVDTLAAPVRYPFRSPNAFVWQTAFDQVIYAAPVVGELLSSNPGKEAAVLSGCYFKSAKKKRGAWIKILRLRDGRVLKTIPIAACSSSQPAPGDLNGDGLVDIVTTVNGATDVGGTGQSSLFAVTPNTGESLWEVPLPGNVYAGHFTSPVVADLNSDGALEVAAGDGSRVCIFSGRTGERLHCLPVQGAMLGTPTVADLVGDGTLTLLAASRDLYAWTGFNDVIPTEAGILSPYSSPWPTHRGSAARLGMVPAQ